MPYDPRYVYGPRYAAGEYMLGLANLLGQGFGRYRQIGLDETNQQNRKQDYPLMLQQATAQAEDRDLDRDIKKMTAEGLPGQRTAAAAETTRKAQQEATQRSAIGKFMGVKPTVATEEITDIPQKPLPQD